MFPSGAVSDTTSPRNEASVLRYPSMNLKLTPLVGSGKTLSRNAVDHAFPLVGDDG